jgi:hypothetical protein
MWSVRHFKPLLQISHKNQITDVVYTATTGIIKRNRFMTCIQNKAIEQNSVSSLFYDFQPNKYINVVTANLSLKVIQHNVLILTVPRWISTPPLVPSEREHK